MFICIWCQDAKKGIGKNNKLPWHIKEELEFFKKTTINSKVLMGRKTFESIGKPLPNRTNIVFTNNNISNQNILIEKDIEKFINKNKYSKEKIFIIGGYSIYKSFLNHSEMIYVTELDESYDCDLFIDFDLSDYKKELILRNNKAKFSVYLYEKTQDKKQS